MFFTLIFGDNFFLFSMLAKCDCGEVVQRQFLKKVRSLWRKQIFVHIDEEFAINGIQPKLPCLLLTGKSHRGVTERVRLKRIFTSGEYIVIQRLCIS